jgi:reactive intermediate/imine deaminase
MSRRRPAAAFSAASVLLAPALSRGAFVTRTPAAASPPAAAARPAGATLLRASAASAMAENSDIVRARAGPRFNQTVVHNGVCFLAGQVSRGARDDASAQTRGILAQIDTLLEEAGTSKARLLSCTIWLADIGKDLAAMNAEWDRWVDPDNMPVRACVESKLVDDEITVEIQATAAMPPAPRATPVATPHAAAAVGPYNQAVRMRDGTVYVSGCIGLTTAGAFAGPTVEDQTKQCLANLAAIVEASGENGQVVKTTILLDDMNDFAAVNRLYSAFFAAGGRAEAPVPARACFSAKSLPKGALVEIEAIAIVDN